MADARDGQLQFGRIIEVTFGPKGGGTGRSYRNLAVKAEIDKSDGKKPNPGKVTIYGLGVESLALLEADDAQITVKAGYGLGDEQVPILFSGDIDDVKPTGLMRGEDFAVEVEARDGGSVWDSAVYAETFEGRTTQTRVLERLSQKMGVGLQIHPGVQEVVFEDGFVASDMSRNVLSRLGTNGGFDWMLRDEQLVITPSGEPGAGEVFLIDGPQILDIKQWSKGKGKTKKKGWEVKVNLNALLKPKDKVILESRWGAGTFKVRSAKHTADNWEDPFESTLILEA